MDLPSDDDFTPAPSGGDTVSRTTNRKVKVLQDGYYQKMKTKDLGNQ